MSTNRWRELPQRRAAEVAERGDLAALEEVPVDGAWRMAFDAMRFLAGLDPQPPSWQALRELRPISEDNAWLFAAAQLARERFLAMDRSTLTDLAQWVADARPCEVELSLLRELVVNCSAVLSGTRADANRLTEIAKEARHAELPGLVIDATSLAAWVGLEAGDVSEGLAMARRASRQGRTESMPQSEYFANLALARLRRYSGYPHLSTKITESLRRVAPLAWHRWLDWEAMMAQGVGWPRLREPQLAPVESLRDWLVAVSDGEAERANAGARTLLAANESISPLARDTRNAVAVLLEGSLSSPDPNVDEWIGGTGTAPPFGLGGLAGIPVEVGGGSRSSAIAVFRQAGRCRRVLRPGLVILDEPRPRGVEPASRLGRPDSLLSILALAGPTGLKEDELFRRVYGFAYSAEKYAGTFQVLRHRARGQLRGFGDIERRGDIMRIVSDCDLAFVDPSCAPDTHELLLSLIAGRARITMRDAAAELGIATRSAQLAIERLIEEGACQRRKDGRRVEYEIEDTTFQEPTRSR